MLAGILLIVLGLLAVPSLILAKKPDAKALFDKIAPYQGWIGLVFAFWGIWGIIGCIRIIDFISLIPIYWITALAVAVVELALGFILGYGMIQKYALSKDEAAKAKGEQLLKKLLPLQGTLGIIAICLGLWMIVAHILWMTA